MKDNFISLGIFNKLLDSTLQDKPSGLTREVLRKYNGKSYGVKLHKATDYDCLNKTTTIMFFVIATNYKDKSKSIAYQYEDLNKANLQFDSLLPASAIKPVKDMKELSNIIKSIKLRGL